MNTTKNAFHYQNKKLSLLDKWRENTFTLNQVTFTLIEKSAQTQKSNTLSHNEVRLNPNNWHLQKI